MIKTTCRTFKGIAKASPYLMVVSFSFICKIVIQRYVSDVRLQLMLLDGLSMLIVSLSSLHMIKSFEDARKSRREWDDIYVNRMKHISSYEKELEAVKKTYEDAIEEFKGK